VCGWAKAGVNQSPVLPYASVGPSPVNRIFDVSRPWRFCTSPHRQAARRGWRISHSKKA